ncbi:hypothetical protein A8F94_04390 [Bacillus sp. FJAT-27225]|uniref:YqgU-like beta propeller domain-containing protein n=1 Tax=Bacillus sp. FJAT-27225 TaxID=1743144 RepID=UPI00080C30E7|nr:hypothetical protein [Bacillus sp. FJAT-27225]OCA91105.1 hypothetical protein A8F94_04390 [Bacillus sp. FJAT-27225]
MGLYRFRRSTFTAAKALFICLVFLFLTACTKPEALKVMPPLQSDEPSEQTEEENGGASNWRLPIQVPEGEFFKTFGWLNESELIYASNLASGSNLYSYSLGTGESRLILSSNTPIVTAAVSPDMKKILVHTSPSSFEAIVSIYDLEGNELMTQSFPSAELRAEWNPYVEDLALIIAFNEDWTYSSYQMDTNENHVDELDLPDPFAKWAGKELVAYLKWDENTPSFFAPLVIKDLKGDITSSLDEQYYHIEAYENLLVSISRDKLNEDQAVYTFYTPQLKELGSFVVPHLTKFSDWLVPFQAYSPGSETFAVFEPIRSGEADAYTEGFTLASYEIGGSREVILEGVDNQPIVYSPDGKTILYGYRLERLIDPRTKKVINLIEESGQN